jgi:hypothetical protein
MPWTRIKDSRGSSINVYYYKTFTCSYRVMLGHNRSVDAYGDTLKKALRKLQIRVLREDPRTSGAMMRLMLH